MFRDRFPYGGAAQSAAHHIEVTQFSESFLRMTTFTYMRSLFSTVKARGRNATANSVVARLSARVSFAMVILSRIPMARSCSGSTGKLERFYRSAYSHRDGCAPGAA